MYAPSMPTALHDDVFRAVADPTRRRVLELLRAGPLSAGEIHRHFDMSQPAVSQHLRVLRNAGTVTVRRAGRHHVYALDGSALRTLHDWAGHFEAFWTEGLARLGRYLDEAP